MDATLFRTREALLWMAATVSLVGSMLLYLLVPGMLGEALAGTMEGEVLDDGLGFQMAAMLGVPVLVVVATLFVGDRLNRYLNVVGGLLFGLLGSYGVGSHLADGEVNGHVALAALATLLAFLIAALGVAALRRPAPDSTATATEPSRHHFDTAA